MSKRFQRVGGGLLGVFREGRSIATPLLEPTRWVAPAWLDLRPYCLEADDQGDEPLCAAYAMACVVEAYNWRRTHIAKQLDPHPIYAEAKKLDGLNSDGTTLEAVAQAALNMRLLPEGTFWKYFKTFDEYCYALHAYGLVLLGFNITDGWNSCNPKSGWIGSGRMPTGGHAVVGCWYSRLEPKGVGVQNSWGKWGCGGFGRMTIEQFNGQIMGGLAFVIP